MCVCVYANFSISTHVIISGKEYEEFIMSIFVFKKEIPVITTMQSYWNEYLWPLL